MKELAAPIASHVDFLESNTIAYFPMAFIVLRI
jgi:hypothetical protein